ncbi:MAG: MFS transporter [Pseudomonadota bacterium]
MIDKDENWNYGTLLGQSIFVSLAYRLTSPKLVLPFLYTALGAPVVFAGLLLPVVQISRLISQLASAPIMSKGGLRKFYIALGTVILAAALGVAGLATNDPRAGWLAVLFLLIATIIGIAQGLSGIAYWDLFGRVVPSHRQSTLLFSEAAVAAALAILIALASQRFVSHDDALHEHLELLWLGIAIAVLSCVIIALVREDPPSAPEPEEQSGGFWSEVRGFQATTRTALGFGWFRRFNVSRALFLSVQLAMPFYAVHAAGHHAHSHHSMATFVISSSAGIIAGSLIWQNVVNRSLQLAMVVAPAIAGIAGIIAIFMEVAPETRGILLYGFTFLLLAFAAQGTSNAGSLYLVRFTTEENRSHYIAVSDFLAGTAGIVVAFAFGILSHLQGAVWPIVCIVTMNFVACAYAMRLDKSELHASSGA